MLAGIFGSSDAQTEHVVSLFFAEAKAALFKILVTKFIKSHLHITSICVLNTTSWIDMSYNYYMAYHIIYI